MRLIYISNAYSSTLLKKKNTNSICWQGCGEKGTLVHCWRECKLIQSLQRTAYTFLKKLKIVRFLNIKLQLSFCWASLVAQLVKNPPAMGSIPGLGRSPREGKRYPLQYSGLENPMDCIVAKSCNYTVATESDMTSNEYSGLISFRIDRLDLLSVQGTLKSLLQHHSSKASILHAQFSLQTNSHIHT